MGPWNAVEGPALKVPQRPLNHHGEPVRRCPATGRATPSASGGGHMVSSSLFFADLVALRFRG